MPAFFTAPIASSSEEDDEKMTACSFAATETAVEVVQEDFNRASEADLAAAKKSMSIVFEQNLRKPGSPGYIHDLRKDFGQAEEECDWDDDSC